MTIESSRRSISFEWSQLPGDIIEGYIITLSIGCGDSLITSDTLGGSVRSYQSGDIEEFSEVTVTLLVMNIAGNNSVTFTTSTLSIGKLKCYYYYRSEVKYINISL